MDVRGKAWERICFGVAGLGTLELAYQLGRHGLTDGALFALGLALSAAAAGGWLRYRRQLTEFRKLYPGWQGERDFGQGP